MKDHMRKLVQQGYDNGDYAHTFRRDRTMPEMAGYFLDKTLQLSPPTPKILDLGSGTGVPFDAYLVERGADVTGVDISQKHTDAARENVPGARFVKGDFSRIDFDGESFDAAIALYAIFHIPRDEHAELFLKVHGLLRARGVFLATLGTRDAQYEEEQDWAGASMMAWSTYDPDAYMRLVGKSGFVIVETKFEGQSGDKEHHFWLLAQKA